MNLDDNHYSLNFPDPAVVDAEPSNEESGVQIRTQKRRVAKLHRRQRYEYRDIDRNELRLIRVGHFLWGLYKQARRVEAGGGMAKTELDALEGRPLSESGALMEALEAVWAIKKAFRVELRVKLGERAKMTRAAFAKLKEAQ